MYVCMYAWMHICMYHVSHITSTCIHMHAQLLLSVWGFPLLYAPGDSQHGFLSSWWVCMPALSGSPRPMVHGIFLTPLATSELGPGYLNLSATLSILMHLEGNGKWALVLYLYCKCQLPACGFGFAPLEGCFPRNLLALSFIFLMLLPSL